jgi:hypothetical protein
MRRSGILDFGKDFHHKIPEGFHVFIDRLTSAALKKNRRFLTINELSRI